MGDEGIVVVMNVEDDGKPRLIIETGKVGKVDVPPRPWDEATLTNSLKTMFE